MAINHTFQSTNGETVGSKLKTFTYTSSGSAQISRSELTDLPYVGDGEAHPTLGGVIRDSETLWPISGSIACVYNWSAAEDADVSASISGWRSLVERADTTVTVDLAARQATVTIDGDYNHADWVSHPTKWILNSGTATASTSAGAKIVCIERLVNQDDWTLEYLCVAAGSTKQITKEGTDCYLFVSGAATIGSTSIDAGDTVAMSSSSATITATDRCVVVRAYK